MIIQSRELYFFYGLLILVAGICLLIFLPFLSVLILAIIFAVVLHPLYFWVCRSLRLSPTSSAILVILMAVVVIIFLLTFVFSQIIFQARGFYFQLQMREVDFLARTTEILQGPIQRFVPQFELDLRSYLFQVGSWVAERAGLFLSGTVWIIFKTFIWLLALFYFLRDGRKLRQSISRFSPLGERYDNQILDRIGKTINAVFRGFLIIGLIQGVLAGFGLWIIGVPNPALWGTVAGLTAFIPGVGTSVVMIPAVFYLGFTATLVQAIILLVWWLLSVGLVDYSLAPVLYSRGVPVHPFFMLLSVLGGVLLLGPTGLIIGPIMLSVLIVLLDIYRQPEFSGHKAG